jgi:multidrug resistance efflux pump
MRKSAAVTEGATPQAKSERANEPLTAKRVLLLQGLGLLAILVIGALIFYLWHQGYYYYSDDDAVVSGTTANASSSVNGIINQIYHNVGDNVQKGDTIATVTSSSGATTTVVSPITGTIYNMAVTQGEYVTDGETVAQVEVQSTLYITAYVNETTVKDVHIGQGVDVTVAGEYMYGRVQLIQPVTAGETSALPTTDYANGNFTHVNQRVPVRVWIYGANGHIIYPGESASVKIHLHSQN